MKTLLEIVDAIAQIQLPFAWDPAAWVAFHSRVPLWAAGALVAAGLLVWMFGSNKTFFRFVLAVPFACLGLLLGPKFAAAAPSLSPAVATHGLAAGLALLSIFLPAVVLFVSFGFVAGLFIGRIVAARNQDFAWGFLPGFFGVGALALALRPWTMRLVSSLVGAGMLGLGMLKLLSYTPLAKLSVAAPAVDVALLAVLALLGTMYQARTSKGGRGKGRKRSSAGRIDMDAPQRKAS